jgi:uncharacterized protein YndB with AHSA1/START domain
MRELRLHLERAVAGPPERVWAAFTDAASLAEWWGPEGFTCPAIELDARAGGRYRITMQPPEGDPFHLSGEFREVEQPRRLAFTFVWEEPDPDDRETVAALSFEQDGDRTRIVLDQEPFATDARLVLHRQGWTETLDRLERFLA